MAGDRELTNRPIRVLLVNPVATFLPAALECDGFSETGEWCRTELTAPLAGALVNVGVDIHLAIPHYRAMFQDELAALVADEIHALQGTRVRLHLAENRALYYRDACGDSSSQAFLKAALAFQFEVANRILPYVKPDVVHAIDWMTGLIPAVAHSRGALSLFNVHHFYTAKPTMEALESQGWTPVEFWQRLYFERMPVNYAESRATNPVDLLTTGVFSSDFVTTPSSALLSELAAGAGDTIPVPTRNELLRKIAAGRTKGILGYPGPEYDPATDPCLERRYSPADHSEGKRANKIKFQQALGLPQNPAAPLLFWPARLNPENTGCELFIHILPEIMTQYAAADLQVAFIADGMYQKPFRDTVCHHGLESSVAVHAYSEPLWRLGFAGADFALLPARFVPCARLAQIACRYGTLPIVFAAGAVREALAPLMPDHDTGNSIIFEVYDRTGLRWAIDQALAFYNLAPELRQRQIARVMAAAMADGIAAVAAQYAELYRKILELGPHS